MQEIGIVGAQQDAGRDVRVFERVVDQQTIAIAVLHSDGKRPAAGVHGAGVGRHRHQAQFPVVEVHVVASERDGMSMTAVFDDGGEIRDLAVPGVDRVKVAVLVRGQRAVAVEVDPEPGISAAAGSVLIEDDGVAKRAERLEDQRVLRLNDRRQCVALVPGGVDIQARPTPRGGGRVMEQDVQFVWRQGGDGCDARAEEEENGQGDMRTRVHGGMLAECGSGGKGFAWTGEAAGARVEAPRGSGALLVTGWKAGATGSISGRLVMGTSGIKIGEGNGSFPRS